MAEADAVKWRRLRWRCRRLAVTLFLASAAAACGGGHQDRPPWLDSFAYGRTVQSVDTAEPIVALTFDDGPNEPYTSRILDVLAEQDVKATFFVVGVNATRFPRTLLRIVAEGHEVANHTWSHMNFSRLPPGWMRAEIEQGADVLEALSGVRARLLRPPGGDSGDAAELRRTCQELECLIVKWSVSGQDIDDFEPVPGMIVDSVLEQVEPGAIVLLHDGDGLEVAADKGATVQALGSILRGLAARGYRLVTVSELLDRAGS